MNKNQLDGKVRVFRKKKGTEVYWDVQGKKYVRRSEIPNGALVIDHNGREIKF